MNLRGIVAVSGKPGLFKLIGQNKTGFILESLDGLKTKAIVNMANAKLASLEDITIFGEDDDLKLIDIFERMKKITAIPDTKADGHALKTFFKEAAPKHDDERVYSSDIKKIINWFNDKKSLDFEMDEDLAGGCSYDKHGTPITDEVFYKALESEVVMLGAVGGPKWDNLEFSKKPERALLKLRKELKLFANLRPAICFEQLVNASTLKPEIVSGLDIMIVRELTGGIYFGEPRGIKPIENGERKGINTHTYTTSEITRVARIAFDLAKKRSNKVTSCEKSNVMEAGQLWKEEVQELHDKEYKDVELSHMLADNCAMQLLRNPKQFDVIVTDNLFGDMLSDQASMLTGSLGLLPSASLGAKNKDGEMRAMYEPIHGSAPDIAGKGIANPIASILSFAMALRYSLDLDNEADALEKAVQDVLNDGLRTKDILSEGMKETSTSEMGDAIISKLQ